MKTSVRLGRIAGVEVGFNWSLLVIAALLAAGLAGGRFPSDAPGYSNVEYAIAGVLTAIVFLVAVLVHELSHAVVARHEGIEVDGITLWLLGGVTRMHGDAPTPAAELRVSGAGPLASLVVGVVLFGIGIGLDAAGISPLIVDVLIWLGYINVILAVFNVLPGAPLDGGRLLHAFLWKRHGDRFRATQTASRAGQGLGWALVALGFVEFAIGTGLGGGLWLALLGWFLITAAGAEEERALVQEALGSRRVADVMAPMPATVPDSVTVRDFVDHYLLAHRHSAFPVVDAQGRPVGLVTLERVRSVPAHLRGTTLVRDIAIPVAQTRVARANDPARDLLDSVVE
ncbi:MAG: site-2 protease family protein, partial [Actinobacteria bacterium]|nr:site-2 protease family protein [Actinomycetota bacterium]